MRLLLAMLIATALVSPAMADVDATRAGWLADQCGEHDLTWSRGL